MRGGNGVVKRTYDEVYEEQMLERLKAGKVVRVYKASHGWQFISNKGRAINGAKRRGYVTEEEALAAGVPMGPHGSHKGHNVTGDDGASAPKARVEPEAKAEEAPKPKRGPGRPRKVKDGE